MAVDTLAYGGNLWAACNEDDSRAERARVSLLTSGASILVLYVVTGWGMVEAVEEIIEKHPDDDLRPGIVLIFGVLGLVVDFAALAAFKVWGDDGDPHGHGALDEDVADIVGDAAVLPPVSYDRVEGAASTDDDDSDGGDADPLDAVARSADAMNMCAAFSHVAADTVRSVTSIALGLLTTLDDDVNGASWDAYFATGRISTRHPRRRRDLRGTRGAAATQPYEAPAASPRPGPRTIYEASAASPRPVSVPGEDAASIPTPHASFKPVLVSQVRDSRRHRDGFVRLDGPRRGLVPPRDGSRQGAARGRQLPPDAGQVAQRRRGGVQGDGDAGGTGLTCFVVCVVTCAVYTSV